MRDETDLVRLTDRLAAVVEETMQPTQMSVWLREQASDATPMTTFGGKFPAITVQSKVL